MRPTLCCCLIRSGKTFCFTTLRISAFGDSFLYNYIFIMDSVSANQSIMHNAYGIPVTIFANEAVKVEQAALEELRSLLDLQKTIEEIRKHNPDFFAADANLQKIVITPDFHKGKGIPIGTTMLTEGFIAPQAIGKDVNCGMRLLLTDLSEAAIRAQLPKLMQAIRYVYFEGGRQIPLTPRQKQALLRKGLIGLLETYKETEQEGLWKYYDPQQQEADLGRVMDMGSLVTEGIFEGLENYIKHPYKSYDSQLGSIGGGNHFVEVQRVNKIHNGAIAHQWGIKEGMMTIMIHTGSVSVGYPTAAYFVDILQDLYPKNLRFPKNGIFPLPFSEQYGHYWDNFWMALHNAANFAFGNRLFLGLMMQRVMAEHFGNFNCQLLYDSGHNMLWKEEVDGKTMFVHRKGACSARGPEQLQGTEFAWTGEPVLIPGSMGAASFILAGKGCSESLCSTSHGAGRSMSRGDSLKIDDALFEAFMRQFNIITPIDPLAHNIKGRKDILQKWKEEIKKEAPFAFKEIGPVIETQVDSGMADVVAELEPIFTVKG